MWLDTADSSTYNLTGSALNWIQDKSSNAFFVSSLATNAKPIISPTFNGTYSALFASNDGNKKIIGTPLTVPASNVQGASGLSYFLVGQWQSELILAQFEQTGVGGSRIVGIEPTGTNIRVDYVTSLTTTNPINVPFLGSVVYNNSSLAFYYNGNTPTTGAREPVLPNYTSGYGFFGQNTGNGDYPGYGFIGEYVGFASALSTSDRQVMEGYLAWKWGLQANLPASHPYKQTGVYSYPPFPLVARVTAITNKVVFDPRTVSGLQLWFDAADSKTFTLSGTSIVRWNDKSSNAYNVIQPVALNQPSYTANALNTFGGVQLATSTFLYQQGSNMPNFTTGANTSVFVVAKNASANTGWNIFNTIWFTSAGGDSATLRYHFSFNRDPGGGIVAGTSLYAASGFAGQVTSNAVAPSSNAMLGFTASATSVTIHTNGSSDSFSGVSLPNANNATLFLLGENRNGSNVGSNVVLYEMIGYNTQVSASDRQKIEGYFAWKWGLTSLLPTGHPYRVLPIQPYPYVVVPRSINQRGFSPRTVTGIALWLDAADAASVTLTGGNVTAITDKSGTGKTITVTATVGYTLSNAFVFTNTSGLFTVASMPPAPYDILTVATANASTATFRTLLRTANAPGTHPLLLNTGANTLGMWNGAQFNQFGSLTLTPNEKALMYVTMASGRTIQAAKNGTEGLTASSPAGNESIITVVGNSTGGGQPWGTLQELVIYSTTLATPDRQRIEGYLAWKWALQSSLPSTHPFKLFPPPA